MDFFLLLGLIYPPGQGLQKILEFLEYIVSYVCKLPIPIYHSPPPSTHHYNPLICHHQSSP